MLRIVEGNLLDWGTEALVNPVNCVGVMGKGLALQFKEKYPDNFRFYNEACNRKEVKIGEMLVYSTRHKHGQKYIINFPTKDDWKDPSKMRYIVDGLADLFMVISRLNIRSIAIPALGCGLGGLSWEDVSLEVEIAYRNYPKELDVYLYKPKEVK